MARKTGKAQNADEASLSFEEFRKMVLEDYRIANESRQASILGRREVLTGKAKFGIFGDGKEVAQLAMAKQFREGDFRSGYYRDQTFMMAAGLLNMEEYFAQLYAHTDVHAEPSSAGRSMNGHYATRTVNDDGSWKQLSQLKNSSADISPTAAQMPRLLGLAQASKLFRDNKSLHAYTQFSEKGNEVAFGTIGDASTSEGLFFETINAAGVLQVPMAISIWDDGYGISVPKKFQTTKESISEILKGLQRDESAPGYEIFRTKGWDYPGLCETYEKAIAICRNEHVPVMIHVEEVTQPQGHSTSGSHERYKSKERLSWAEEHDCIKKMREWILQSAIASDEELTAIEKNAIKLVRDAKNRAWEAFQRPIRKEREAFVTLINTVASQSPQAAFIHKLRDEILGHHELERRTLVSAARKILRMLRLDDIPAKERLQSWLRDTNLANLDRYQSHLYSQSDHSSLLVDEVKPEYNDDQLVDGREVLRDNFDAIFSQNPLVVAFGEDVGYLGGVNQAFEGLQLKHGENRIMDTGIREATIIGQGIGMSMRGLRPIAEIQYLDYLLYALQIISDDLATVRWRTKGGQMAPLIIRTRGHRLEGIWHAGSPMATIIHSFRGVNVLVPRDMTRAAGFYNTMLLSDDPALIIEPLNGYRLKEKLPSNLGQFTVPVGVPEVLSEGTDVTIVTYGSLCRLALEAVKQLQEVGISCELIDVQSLLPFDVNHTIVESLKKTNRILFLDEDVPGGGTAYMMQQVLEEQGGYRHLDAAPVTLSAKEHRPAYGSDGDYFSKPNVEDIFEAVYRIMNESDPTQFPAI
ncbi:MAG: transketolase [Flavobacteriales bacterium]|nr:transketolase [Flavobacteriales bacterium]MCB9447690.1 transketolase [Flavobacteriales bacterium]